MVWIEARGPGLNPGPATDQLWILSTFITKIHRPFIVMNNVNWWLKAKINILIPTAAWTTATKLAINNKGGFWEYATAYLSSVRRLWVWLDGAGATPSGKNGRDPSWGIIRRASSALKLLLRTSAEVLRDNIMKGRHIFPSLSFVTEPGSSRRMTSPSVCHSYSWRA